MEGEIRNFMMVWSFSFALVSYCYAMSKIVSKGKQRLFAFFPVMCLFSYLPINLKGVHLGCPTAFFITWLANFKLLLLAFGNGPLSGANLSLGQFITIACLPILLRQNSNKESLNEKKPKISIYAKKSLILGLLLCEAPFMDYLPKNILMFLICVYVIVGLEVMLGVVAVLAHTITGLELELPFDAPHLSTSLKDFWGRRWNRVSTSILREAVFVPIARHTLHVLGKTWGVSMALFGTFLVSGLMHEIIFFYLGRRIPSWGTTFFFIIHSICLMIENIIKVKLHIPQLITGTIVYGFVIITFILLCLPELLQYDVCNRALQEYAALGSFLRDIVALVFKDI